MNTIIENAKSLMKSGLMLFFNCFPIQKNKLFFFSYYGSQYSGNPKHITEYILKHNLDKKLKVVWAFNDLESMQHLSGFEKVKTMTLKCFFHLCTSKVVITNYRTTKLYKKRKKQYYIQTWHSSLRLKQIEKDAMNSLPEHYIEMAINDSKKCNLLLSGCKLSTNIFKQSFWYNGKIFEYGTPRNDILINQNMLDKKEIMQKLSLPKHTKILLYAPTFRKDANLEVYNIQYEKLIIKLKEKFAGEWTILMRLHPHLSALSNALNESSNVKNVTSYDDVQELLGIADVLISDYSSLMFDFAYTNRPCFLYVPDLQEYIKNDRKLYFKISDLPFIKASSNEELLEQISLFDQKVYEKSLDGFLDKIGSFENGNASEEIVKHIKSICFKNEGSSNHEAV